MWLLVMARLVETTPSSHHILHSAPSSVDDTSYLTLQPNTPYHALKHAQGTEGRHGASDTIPVPHCALKLGVGFRGAAASSSATYPCTW